MSHESAMTPPSGPNDDTIIERVQELAWALLDDFATDDDLALLDALLLSDDKARAAYIDCVQLHADLYCHFADSRRATEAGGLGNTPGILALIDSPNVGVDQPPSPTGS